MLNIKNTNTLSLVVYSLTDVSIIVYSDFQLSNISYHPGSSATNLSAHELSYGFCHSVGLMLKQVVFKKVQDFISYSTVLSSWYCDIGRKLVLSKLQHPDMYVK